MKAKEKRLYHSLVTLTVSVGMLFPVTRALAWQTWTGAGDGETFNAAGNWDGNQVPSYTSGGTAASSLNISTATEVLKLTDDIVIDRIQLLDRNQHVFDFAPYTLTAGGYNGQAFAFIVSGARLKLASGTIQMSGAARSYLAVPSNVSIARTGGPVGEFSDCEFVADGAGTLVNGGMLYMNHGTNNTVTISGGARMNAALRFGRETASLRNAFVVTGAGSVFSNVETATSFDATVVKCFTDPGSVSNRFVVANGARLERFSSLGAYDGVGNEIAFTNGTYAIDAIFLDAGRGQRLLFDRATMTVGNGFWALRAATDSTIEFRDSTLVSPKGPSVSIGTEAAGSNNLFRFTRSTLNYGQYQYLGFKGAGNTVLIEDGSQWLKDASAAGSGACFVGYDSTATNNSLIVRDSQMSAVTLRGGYQGARTLVRVEGAGASISADTFTCGDAANSSKGGYNRWEAIAGGEFHNYRGSVNFYGHGNELVVSNGTVFSQSEIHLPADGNGNDGMMLTIAGTNSLIVSTGDSDNALCVRGDTVIRFVVPAEGYSTAPLLTQARDGVLTIGDGVTASFDVSAFMCGESKTCPLARAQLGTLNMSDTAVASFAASLARDSGGLCKLVKTGSELSIKKISGIMLFIR